MLESKARVGSHSDSPSIIIAAGSSNTENNVGNNYRSYATQSAPLFGNVATLTNQGRSGSTISQWVSNFTTWVQPLYDSTKKHNILTMQNTNDIDQGDSPSNAFGYVSSLASLWRAIDSRNKIAVATMWDMNRRQSILKNYISFNSLLTASVGSTIDTCFDVFNIPQLKFGTATPPASITPDFNHLTELGQSYVVPVYAAAVRTLLP
jgi:hypothetical protein